MSTFSSVAWKTFPVDGALDQAWHKHNVPYKADANPLQNLDIWIPKSEEETFAPRIETISRSSGVWVVYIHGGAWRDPLVSSTSFSNTVERLVQNHTGVLDSIAGLVSINYSLSPHPHHPTHPSPPKDKTQPVNPSRQARHPDHITDVLTALAFLQSELNIGDKYILVGHSCGATLALQVAVNHFHWGEAAAGLGVRKPKAIVGLNGLYDLPDLIRNPGPKHEHLKPIYDAFTRLAFEDESLWYDISPVSVKDWAKEWPEGRLIVLVQSREDNLVPYSQLEKLRLSLQQQSVIPVWEMEADGDHNDLWKSGDRLVEIILETVNRLK